MTERQAEMLRFIGDYLADHGYPPTQREMMRRFQIKSTRGVARHLEALQKKGYLIRGEGARAIEIHPSSQGIPIIGKVAAGRPIQAIENIEGRIDLSRILTRWKGAFFLRVKGESMIGEGIFEGDYLLVKPQATVETGTVAVVLLSGEAAVKRFAREGEKIVLHSANPAYPPIEVTRGSGDFRIVGKVVAVFRSLIGPLG
ncbi:MAG: transcriptional repressor LexA [Candidatus Manganitrophaceae bacterium]